MSLSNWPELVLLFLWILALEVASDPRATASAGGSFRGYYLLSSDGRTFEGFSGIRYAQPPVGNRRFQAPAPFEQPFEEQMATEEGPACLQIDPLLKPQTTIGNEDCLFLNVYTHNVSGSAPVMLWIHGGAWRFGSGSKEYYGPDFIMNEDVVLVTFNYRVGPFGFASLESDAMPGNMGLKDQEEAIRWVSSNIAGFGGDPDQITLFGQSAGAASVMFHIKGRLSGLVSRGIAQSGSSLSPWAVGYGGSVRAATLQLAQTLSCNLNSTEQSIVDCLLNKTDSELIDSYKQLPLIEQEKIPFRPVVEKGGPVPANPWQLPPSSHPLLAGRTLTETAVYIANVLKSGSFLITLINNAFNLIVPQLLMFDTTASDPAAVASQVRSFYFNDKNITRKDFHTIEKVASDAWFTYPLFEEIRRHNGSSFSYVYDYIGTHSVYDIYNVSQELRMSAGHADELPYLFRAQVLDLLAEGSYEDLLKSREMVKIWTDFAKGLDPTPGSAVNSSWTDFPSGLDRSLHITHEALSFKDTWPRDRMAFWSSLPFRQQL